MIDYISENYPDVLIADGLDEAILGVASRINFGPVVAYSQSKIIDILVDRDGMTCEEATEYYFYNIIGSYVGENMPIFIDDLI